MKVVVLTTSYPRDDGDAAGRFVADAVEHLRRRQIEVEVVSPKAFRHYGIAYGSGILGNLRREPWRAFLSPLMLAGFRRAARRAAADADLPVVAVGFVRDEVEHAAVRLAAVDVASPGRVVTAGV